MTITLTDFLRLRVILGVTVTINDNGPTVVKPDLAL